MDPREEEKLLEKLRAKLGAPQKMNEKSELERLFGKAKAAPETALRKKLARESIKVGDICSLYIEKIAASGWGLGKYNNSGIFVEGTVPGDTVEVKITQVKSDAFFGEVLKRIAPSSNRISPRCSYYSKCGGCDLQDLAYPAQLQAKTVMVQDTLMKVGGISEKVRSTIGSPDPFGYRIKVKLHVDSKSNPLIVGFKAKRSSTIIQINECPLLVPAINQVIPHLQDTLPNPGTAPLPEEIQLHAGTKNGLVVIHLCAREQLHYLNEFYSAMKAKDLPVQGVSAEAPNWRASAGDAMVSHRVGNWEFKLPGSSFFQVNRFLHKLMHDHAIMMASPGAKDSLLDLYCGVGFFTLPFCRFTINGYGIDGDGKGISVAKENAGFNKINNADFGAASDTKFFNNKTIRNSDFNLIIADPPRAGLSKEVRAAIIRMKPQKFLYISCNPSTLARDLKEFSSADFRLRLIQPVDLFPNTSHVEVFTFLTHRYSAVQAASAAMPDLK